MRIELQGYASDYTITGWIDVEDERLSDSLGRNDELYVENVVVTALEDAREHELPWAVVEPDELCAVVGTDPRGRREDEFQTRAYPMRAQLGPYEVAGYFHALPTADPYVVALAKDIIPLRPARLRLAAPAGALERRHEELLLIRRKLERFESASDEEVGMPPVVVSPVIDEA